MRGSGSINASTSRTAKVASGSDSISERTVPVADL